MTAILSSLSLLVSSLFLGSFRAVGVSFGLGCKQKRTVGSLPFRQTVQESWSPNLSRGASPAVEAMAAVTPGVAFDLSVNLESKAFMGSILEAEVSSRLAFILKPQKKKEVKE